MTTPAKPAWYRRAWLHLVAVAVIALLAGIGIGQADTSAEDKATDRAAAAEARADQEAARADQATSDLTAAQEATSVAKGEAANALATARSELATAKAAQDQDAKTRLIAIQRREAAVSAREKAVTGVERDIEDNTVDGDGLYEVGTDIKAGTYRSTAAASGNCYYARLDSPGGDIIDNNNVSGQVIVVVRNGEYLELSGCNSFVLQR